MILPERFVQRLVQRYLINGQFQSWWAIVNGKSTRDGPSDHRLSFLEPTHGDNGKVPGMGS